MKHSRENGLSDGVLRGRGALSNPAGRFERSTVEPFDDGWSHGDERPHPKIETRVTTESTKSIITRNDSPDVPFDRSINPYRGCEHGCVYCFARPSHAFLGMSPGLDFETRIIAKPQAPEVLAKQLSARGYTPEVIALGSNTDPYQPVERDLRITRRVLEVLRDFNHPVTIVTKSTGVLRDLDILAPMAERRLASVAISVTTLDPDLARRMEPRAATPQRRIDTMRALTSAGIPVAVLASPLFPGLTDHELDHILEAASQAGATSAAYIVVRLPYELKTLVSEWLQAHFPERAERVLSLIRQMRDGALNQAEFGTRMTGQGVFATMLQKRFELACRRFDLAEHGEPLDTTAFRVPVARGSQLRLFD